jgi:sulfhydrogenase subunit beta (sulfur reductase)
MNPTNDSLGAESAAAWLPRTSLQALLDLLRTEGYQVIGPRIDQGAIVYAPLERVEDLPLGWSDEQAPGLYRLKKRDDQAAFGYVVGPHSWKRYLFPPQTDLMRSKHSNDGWEMSSIEPTAERYAFLGVRACELAAMDVQDRVFISPMFTDELYRRRREEALIIAVNCTSAASTCFCTSMGTGPRCRSGFDLALTELSAGFVLEIGSALGRRLVEQLTLAPLTFEHEEAATAARQQAVDQMKKSLDREHVQATLKHRLNHERWDEVAERCLSCANCTMVCPTCFCSSVDDVTNLVDEEVIRQRRWDSCFNFDFSHISGGSVRDQTRSRYRQWLTHKLTHWVDQFGTSGCVGCGRCITWCPVGIDLTEEARILCEEPVTREEGPA